MDLPEVSFNVDCNNYDDDNLFSVDEYLSDSMAGDQSSYSQGWAKVTDDDANVVAKGHHQSESGVTPDSQGEMSVILTEGSVSDDQLASQNCVDSIVQPGQPAQESGIITNQMMRGESYFCQQQGNNFSGFPMVETGPYQLESDAGPQVEMSMVMSGGSAFNVQLPSQNSFPEVVETGQCSQESDLPEVSFNVDCNNYDNYDDLFSLDELLSDSAAGDQSFFGQGWAKVTNDDANIVAKGHHQSESGVTPDSQGEMSIMTEGSVFNDQLASQNCVDSIVQPGQPAQESGITTYQMMGGENYSCQQLGNNFSGFPMVETGPYQLESDARPQVEMSMVMSGGSAFNVQLPSQNSVPEVVETGQCAQESGASFSEKSIKKRKNLRDKVDRLILKDESTGDKLKVQYAQVYPLIRNYISQVQPVLEPLSSDLKRIKRGISELGKGGSGNLEDLEEKINMATQTHSELSSKVKDLQKLFTLDEVPSVEVLKKAFNSRFQVLFKDEIANVGGQGSSQSNKRYISKHVKKLKKKTFNKVKRKMDVSELQGSEDTCNWGETAASQGEANSQCFDQNTVNHLEYFEKKLYNEHFPELKFSMFQGLEEEVKAAYPNIPMFLQPIAGKIQKSQGMDIVLDYNIILVSAAIKEMNDLNLEQLDCLTLLKWGATFNKAKEAGFHVKDAEAQLKSILLMFLALKMTPK